MEAVAFSSGAKPPTDGFKEAAVAARTLPANGSRYSRNRSVVCTPGLMMVPPPPAPTATAAARVSKRESCLKFHSGQYRPR